MCLRKIQLVGWGRSRTNCLTRRSSYKLTTGLRPTCSAGMSHEIGDNVGAEAVHMVEGNMCGTATRGADALPGSMATSRTKGARRNLGDLVSPAIAKAVS